jgi:NADPH2:quinone reductase
VIDEGNPLRVFELTEYIGPTGLKAAQREPVAAVEGEIGVRVCAIGVNFPDLLLTQGRYQLRPELPCVPGCEIAGIVSDTPADSLFSVGDRVAAFTWTGGFAEHAVVPASHAVRISDRVPMRDAAATVVNYHTVLFALQRRAQLKPGDAVLVMGAGGGIGTAALQVARGLGAHVIAGVGDPAQGATAARALPGVEVVVLEEGFSSRVRELTGGRGVDVVLDPLGDWLFGESVRALAPEGRVIVIGFAAGGIPEIAVNRLLLRNVGVLGAAFGAFLENDSELMQGQSDTLERFIDQGVVAPTIEVAVPFDELPAQLARLERGEVRGKAVVVLDDNDHSEHP